MAKLFFTFFLFFQLLISQSAFAGNEKSRVDQFKTPPERQVGSQNYATVYDVGRCAALAEGIAVFGWYSQPILASIGGSTQWASVKLATLTKSADVAKGIELLLVTITGYNLNTVTNYTVGQFWDYVIAPQVEACKRVGFDYWEGIRGLEDLISQPDFFTPHEFDGPGITMGRSCAKDNLGYTSYNFFGGGLDGCKKCCGSRMNKQSGISNRIDACIAVCNAQFQ
jgi:hypothetical protein